MRRLRCHPRRRLSERRLRPELNTSTTHALNCEFTSSTTNELADTYLSSSVDRKVLTVDAFRRGVGRRLAMGAILALDTLTLIDKLARLAAPVLYNSITYSNYFCDLRADHG